MKCAEMTEIIGKHLADDLSIKLKNAHFISVQIDGHQIFWDRKRVAVESAFSDIEVPNWKDKVVVFGVDGASVKLGKKGGVAAKLQQHVPHLL